MKQLLAVFIAYAIPALAMSPNVQASFNTTTGNLTIAIRGSRDSFSIAGMPSLNGFRWITNSSWIPSNPDYVWAHKCNWSVSTSGKDFTSYYHWGKWTVEWDDSYMNDNILKAKSTLTSYTNNTIVDFMGLVIAQGPRGVYNGGRWPFRKVVPQDYNEIPSGSFRNYWSLFPTDEMPKSVVADWGDAAVAVQLPSNPLNTTLGFYEPDGWHLALRHSIVEPGASAVAEIELRFGAGSGPNATDRQRRPFDVLTDLAASTYSDFRRKHPEKLEWKDRRPIGTLFPAGKCGASCSCKSLAPEDCPNPRGWTVGPDPGSINTTDPAGVKAFQEAFLQYVNGSIERCTAGRPHNQQQHQAKQQPTSGLDCQGIIIWSIEGQQYPQDITYIGSPDMLPVLAPEMDGIADEAFAMMQRAGLRGGLTLRPQVLTINPNHSSTQPPDKPPFKYYQKFLLKPDGRSDVQAVADNLIRKIQYARKRWGDNLSIFYVDSTVTGPGGGALDAEVFELVYRAVPGILMAPEESDLAYRRVSAPLTNNEPAPFTTPIASNFTWPESFSVNLMQGSVPRDANRTVVDAYLPAVCRGDVLLCFPWFDDPRNGVVQQAYALAKQPGVCDGLSGGR